MGSPLPPHTQTEVFFFHAEQQVRAALEQPGVSSMVNYLVKKVLEGYQLKFFSAAETIMNGKTSGRMSPEMRRLKNEIALEYEQLKNTINVIAEESHRKEAP